MLKKIILWFIIFFSIISFANAYKVDLWINIENTKWIPISNKVVDFYNSNWWNLKLVSDDNWKIKMQFEYNDEKWEKWESFSLNINWNYIYIEDFSPEIKNIKIIYNDINEKIEKVIWVNSKINNQEIKKLTNYKGLILFFFFTILSFVIMFWWMLFYQLLFKDVQNYQK